MRDATTSARTYQLLFMFTFFVGIVELYFLMRHDEPVRTVSEKNKRAMDWAIFKNNQYVLFLVVALVFNFGWQMAWGLFNIYNIRYAESTIFGVAFGMSTAPLLTVLSTNHYYLVLMYVLSGLFISGTVLILFNLLLENSPQEVNTYCITTYNVLLAIISFTSPQIGIWLLEIYSMNNAMYISTTIRFLAAVGFLVLYITRKRRKVMA